MFVVVVFSDTVDNKINLKVMYILFNYSFDNI